MELKGIYLDSDSSFDCEKGILRLVWNDLNCTYKQF